MQVMKGNWIIMAGVTALILGAGGFVYFTTGGHKPLADPTDRRQVELGARVYGDHCAACHGPNLEGEPDWRTRGPDGLLPAPPHDETGHTWHHSDELLFRMTKDGMSAVVPDYESNMPAFGGMLTDEEIWAALAHIKSHWPEEVRRIQEGINQRASRDDTDGVH
jgi:mono/diheme cytochrome c family protein